MHRRRWILGVALVAWFAGAPLVAVHNLHGHASKVDERARSVVDARCPAYVEPPTVCPTGWHVASAEERRHLQHWGGDFNAEATQRRRDADRLLVEAFTTAMEPWAAARSKDMVQQADALVQSARRFEARAPALAVCLSGQELTDNELRCCEGQVFHGPNADVETYSTPIGGGPRCS